MLTPEIIAQLDALPFGSTVSEYRATYRYIRACDARDWNGTPANWPPDDPRFAVEEVRRIPGKCAQWINHWGANPPNVPD